ncbi:hypothetical protein AZSI13_16310 [Azospira sp. I13]|nr:hypothetical protein AZSI13_16310 [Azospira sp. I13]
MMASGVDFGGTYVIWAAPSKEIPDTGVGLLLAGGFQGANRPAVGGYLRIESGRKTVKFHGTGVSFDPPEAPCGRRIFQPAGSGRGRFA